ncbi:MAG: hypothetical protein COB93_02730 [Sneathiella sp.]|nr:MAG: hypothetical protein COB93_02730 [Sneathiella sp.]
MYYARFLGFIPFCLLVLLAGCEKQDAIMNIGAIYNLTGEQQNLDIPSSQGAELAVAELNQNGGILGRQVSLVLVDGETNTTIIAQKAQQLIDETSDMPVIIGMSDTDVVLAAAKVAAKNQRLFITSGATSPLLPADVPGYLFLACYGDNVQAAAAADWAYSDLKARSVVVLYKEDMSYTALLRAYFEDAFRGHGGDIIVSRGYKTGTFAGAITDLPDADLVYLAASPDEVIADISALRATGYAGPIASGDGFDIGEAWSQLPAENKAYFTTHADVGLNNTDPKVMAFRKAYAAKFPGHEPDAFTALGYDTVMLIAAAAEKAGSLKVDAIRSALSDLQNFGGLTGSISYEDGSHIPIKSVALFKATNGTEVFVREILPTEIPGP